MVFDQSDESIRPGRLGEIIRERRLWLGWNQKQLSQLSGVGHSIINRVESGRTATIRGDSLAKLASVLGVRLDELLGEPRVAANRLSSLPAYTRGNYYDLPPQAQQRIARYVERVRAEYGSSGHGPSAGEDE